MSVQSITNGQLQLSELIVSNEKYSNATGYVASSSSFSSSVDGTSLTVPNITTSNDVTFTNSSFEGTTGYLASEVTVHTGLTRVSMNVPLFSTEQVTISGAGNTQSVTIGSNSSNDFIVTTTTGNGITISTISPTAPYTSTGSGTLTVNSSNQLLWNGVVIS